MTKPYSEIVVNELRKYFKDFAYEVLDKYILFFVTDSRGFDDAHEKFYVEFLYDYLKEHEEEQEIISRFVTDFTEEQEKQIKESTRIDFSCPHCKQADVVFVEGIYPYTTDHYICPECDSTYNLNEFEEEDMDVSVKVKVMIRGHEIDMTLDELRELRDEINGVIGEKPFNPLIPYTPSPMYDYPNNVPIQPYYDRTVPWCTSTSLKLDVESMGDSQIFRCYKCGEVNSISDCFECGIYIVPCSSCGAENSVTLSEEEE